MDKSDKVSTSNQSAHNADQCVDIKEYLWNTTNDLTSLPSTMTVFVVFYSAIIILGVLGNSLVIMSVFKYKSLQSVRNIFIVSLSFSDIVVSLVSGTITPISAFTKVWLFGPALCKFVPLLQGSSLCFSTLTLMSIAIDRFILIIYPTKRSIQTRHAIYMIVLNYIIATSISLPMFLQQQLVSYANFCGQFCAEDWSDWDKSSARSMYGTIVFILQFIVPMLIISFCYSMISIKLAKGMLVKGRGNDQTQKLTAKSDQRKAAIKRRMRTNRMLVSMVLVFLLTWSPSVCFNFLRDYDWLPNFVKAQEYMFGLITHLISVSSTMLNPILYTMLNERFSAAFAEYFRPCRQNKCKIRSQGTPQEAESVASILHLKTMRLSQRLGGRCSSMANKIIFDVKNPDPNVAHNNTKRASLKITHSSISTERENSRDSTQWTSRLIDDKANETENLQF